MIIDSDSDQINTVIRKGMIKAGKNRQVKKWCLSAPFGYLGI
jgi:hypothetical protein